MILLRQPKVTILLGQDPKENKLVGSPQPAKIRKKPSRIEENLFSFRDYVQICSDMRTTSNINFQIELNLLTNIRIIKIVTLGGLSSIMIAQDLRKYLIKKTQKHENKKDHSEIL